MTQTNDVLVITSCTNRKKNIGTVLALEGADSVGSLHELARGWQRQVRGATQSELPAAVDLYAGRSITEARKTAESLSAPLYIISAGHGLLRWDEPIPSYNITVSPAPDNALHRCLLRLRKSPSHWWQALIQAFGRHRSLANVIAESGDAVVLVAVPSAYLSLLADELADLSDDNVKRLRIMTSSHGASNLPVRLQPVVMPYDERLEGCAAYAGTRNDFAQRALRHFVGVLRGHELPPEPARQRVREAMDALQKPTLPERQRRTDDEIVALLRQNWQRFNGSATALLRYLRDEALVSCEQARFRALRQHVLSELDEANCTHG